MVKSVNYPEQLEWLMVIVTIINHYNYQLLMVNGYNNI